MDRTENSSSPTPHNSKHSMGSVPKSGNSIHRFSSSSLAALQKLIGREAQMDSADHKITANLGKDNLSTNIQEAAEKYVHRWQLYSDSYPARIKNKVETFEQLLRMTAKVVFHGKYTNCVPSATKQRLKDKIQECGFKLDDLPSVLLLCLNFCDVIIDPWTKFIGAKSMTAEEIDSIWKEGWILLDERLDTLISTKMFDQAANILEICISKGQTALKSASQDTKEIFDPYWFPHERLLQYMIIYVFLWSRNPNKYTSFRSWRSPMFREVVNYLLSSEEERKDIQHLYPQLKEWKKMKKIGSQFIREAIWVQLKRPNTDSETLSGMMDFLIEYDPVAVGENPSDIPLVKNILSRITEISSSTYLYVLADVIQKNKVGLSEQDMKAKVIEIYIRAMTIDMASIDALKSLPEVDKQRVLEVQKQLSEKYEVLAKFFPNHPATSFQFLLTAHCLCPQKHLFQSLFPETYNELDSANNRMTSVPNTMNNAEELQLPVSICEALATVIYHPRWKSICGWTSAQELKTLCGRFLETGVDSLIGEKELEYLNMDSEKFKNLKPSTEHDDEDDGIEKGYGTKDKRKPRRIVKISSILNRKSKMFKTRRKNNQPDGIENRIPVPKIKRNFIRKVSKPLMRPLIRKNRDGKFNINPKHVRSKLLTKKQRIQVGRKHGNVCSSIRNQKKNYRIFEPSLRHLPPGYKPHEITRINVSDPQNPKIVTITQKKKYIAHATTNIVISYQSLDQESKPMHLKERKILAESETGKLNSFRLCKDDLVFSAQNLNSIRSFRLPNLTYDDVIDAEENWFRRLSSVNLRGLNLLPKVSVSSDPEITSELVELAKESFNLSTQLSQLQNISHYCSPVNQTFVNAASVNNETTDGVNYRLIRPSPKQFQKKQLEKLKHMMLKAYKRRLISVIEQQKLALKEKQSLFLKLSSTSTPLLSASIDPEFSSQDVIIKEEIVKSQSDFEPVSPTQQPPLVTPLSQIEGLSVTYITHKMARDLGRSICFSAKVSAPKQISYTPVKHKVVPAYLPSDNIPVNVQSHLPSNNIVYQSPHPSMSPSCSTMSAQTPSPDSMQCSPDSIAPDLSDDSNLGNTTETSVYNPYPNYNDHHQSLPEDLRLKRTLSQTQYSPPLTFYNYNSMEGRQENTLLGIAGGDMNALPRQENYVHYTPENVHGLNQINGMESPSLLEGPSIQLNHWYAQNQAESLNPSSFIPGDRFPSSPQSNPLDLTNTEQFHGRNSVDNTMTSEAFSGAHVNKIKSPRKKGPRKRKSRSSSECVESVIDHVINNFEPGGVNNCSTTEHPYSAVSEQMPMLSNDLKCIKCEDGEVACNVLNENVISINQDCKPELAFNNCMENKQVKNLNPLDQPNEDVAKQLQEIIESVPVLKDPLNATAEIPVNTLCNQEPNDLTNFSGDRISAMEVILPSAGKQIGKNVSTLSLSDAGTYCNLQSDECENTLEDLPLEPMYTDTAAVAALCDIPKDIENPVVIPLPKRRTKTRSALKRQRRNAELIKICTRELIVSVVPCDSPNSENFHFTRKYLNSFEVSEDTQFGNSWSYVSTKTFGTTAEALTNKAVQEKNEQTVIIEDKIAEKGTASQSIPLTQEVSSGFENKLQNSPVIESPKVTIKEKQLAAVDENKDSIVCENLEILPVEILKIKNNEREEVMNDSLQFELVETLSYFNDASNSSDDNKTIVDRNDLVSDKLVEGIQLESEANKQAIIVSVEKAPPQREEEKVENDDDEVQIVEQIYQKSSTARRVVSINKSAISERLDNVDFTNMTRILNKTQCINRRDHHIKARNYKSSKGIPTNEHPTLNAVSKKVKKRCNVIVDDDDDDDDIQIVAEVASKTVSNQIKKVTNSELIKNKSPVRNTRNKLEPNSSFLSPPASIPCTKKLQSQSVYEKTLVINIERIDLKCLTQRNIEQLNLSHKAPSRHNTRLSNKDKTNKKLHESAVDLKRRKNLEIVGHYVKKPKYFDFPQVERRNLAKKKTIDCEISNDEDLQVNPNSSKEVNKCYQTISQDLIQCEKAVIQVDILQDSEPLTENACNEKTKNQFEKTETDVETVGFGESVQCKLSNSCDNLIEQKINELQGTLDSKHDITVLEEIPLLAIESTSLIGNIEIQQANVNENEEVLQENVKKNQLYQPSEEEMPGNSGIIVTNSDFIQVDDNSIPEELQNISQGMAEDSTECNNELKDKSSNSLQDLEQLTKNTETEMLIEALEVETSHGFRQEKSLDKCNDLIEQRLEEFEGNQDTEDDMTVSEEIPHLTSKLTTDLFPKNPEEENMPTNLNENKMVDANLKKNDNDLCQTSEAEKPGNSDNVVESQLDENPTPEELQNISSQLSENSSEVTDVKLKSSEDLAAFTENTESEVSSNTLEIDKEILRGFGQEILSDDCNGRSEPLDVELEETSYSDVEVASPEQIRDLKIFTENIKEIVDSNLKLSVKCQLSNGELLENSNSVEECDSFEENCNTTMEELNHIPQGTSDSTDISYDSIPENCPTYFQAEIVQNTSTEKETTLSQPLDEELLQNSEITNTSSPHIQKNVTYDHLVSQMSDNSIGCEIEVAEVNENCLRDFGALTETSVRVKYESLLKTENKALFENSDIVSNQIKDKLQDNSSKEVNKCYHTISQDLIQCGKTVTQVDIQQDLEPLTEISCNEKTKTQFEKTETAVCLETVGFGESMQCKLSNSCDNLIEQKINELQGTLDSKHDITVLEEIPLLAIESTSLIGNIEIQQANVNENEEVMQENVKKNQLYQPSEEEMPGNSGIIVTDSDFVQVDKNSIPEELQNISQGMTEDSTECNNELKDKSANSLQDLEPLTENTETEMLTKSLEVETSHGFGQEQSLDKCNDLIEQRLEEFEGNQDTEDDITASEEIPHLTSKLTTEIFPKNPEENIEFMPTNLNENKMVDANLKKNDNDLCQTSEVEKPGNSDNVVESQLDENPTPEIDKEILRGYGQEILSDDCDDRSEPLDVELEETSYSEVASPEQIRDLKIFTENVKEIVESNLKLSVKCQLSNDELLENSNSVEECDSFEENCNTTMEELNHIPQGTSDSTDISYDSIPENCPKYFQAEIVQNTPTEKETTLSQPLDEELLQNSEITNTSPHIQKNVTYDHLVSQMSDNSIGCENEVAEVNENCLRDLGALTETSVRVKYESLLKTENEALFENSDSVSNQIKDELQENFSSDSTPENKSEDVNENEDYLFELSENELLRNDLRESCIDEIPIMSIEPKETETIVRDHLIGLPVLYPISPPRKRRKTQRDFDPPPMLDCYENFKT